MKFFSDFFKGIGNCFKAFGVLFEKNLWPYMFSNVAAEYEERFGLDRAHLRGISENNFANAKRNPNSQTRGWQLTPAHFSDDDNEANPPIEGSLRKSDCGQVTVSLVCDHQLFRASPLHYGRDVRA